MAELQNLKKLQRLFNLMDDDALTKEDFLKSFRLVAETIQKLREQNSKEMSELSDTIKRAEAKLKSDSQSELKKITKDIQNKAEKMFKEQTDALNFIRDKVRDLKDGEDADEEKIVDSVLERIPEVEEFEHPSAMSHRDELEQLKGDERLDWKSIRGLEEQFKEIKEDKTAMLGRSGGGTSAIGVQSALGSIVKNETPSGLINSSNTSYTVNSTIFAVLSFAINGMAITDDEYTVAGNTITMDTAIDTALSGTSFRITYV